jgi:alkylation response protein AidB-like acyl-CoA dehydrogenase
MDVLLVEDERQVLDQARAFLSGACPTSLVRAAESSSTFSQALWTKIVELGWLETCLPEAVGGLGLPMTYQTLLFEEAGRHLAPVPLLSVMVPCLILAKYGLPRHKEALDRARAGDLIFSFAIQEEGGAWSSDAIRMTGRVDGDQLVLNGVKMFVDNFALSGRCLVAFRTPRGPSGLSLALVDTSLPGLAHIDLVPTAKDSQALVRFGNVRISLEDVVGELGAADAIVAEAMDLATLFTSAQMAGAARKATELAVDYSKQRFAFEQPLGSFQAVQHLSADMVIGVDGVELLCREASWKLGQGEGATVEISQAKAFANDKCVMACRSAQQIHGGIGFIMEFDLQLWYRRVVSWSLRCGTTSEHRRRVADHLLNRNGKVRLDRPAPV